MAFIQSPSLFLFFLSLLLSSTHSHMSPVFAIRHQNQNNSETPLLSLPLHPLRSIMKQQLQNNYTAGRIISRLAADSARVKYINSRLSNSEEDNNNIQAPLTYKVESYVTRIRVGQPASEFFLLVDTASGVIWLQCMPCTECYPQPDPIFDPSHSSTYKLLPCESQQCKALRRKECSPTGTCIYKILYDDQASSEGDYATETLSFGTSSLFSNVAIGCGKNNKEPFGTYSGILGLSPSPIALPAQIGATSFSYCLVDEHSDLSSTLDFNSAPPADSVEVPMVRNPVKNMDHYYYVNLTGIMVGRNKIPVPYEIKGDGTGGVVIDSGASVSYFPRSLYESVGDEFKKQVQRRGKLPPPVHTSDFDTCYRIPTISAPTVDRYIPAMSFKFSSGKTLKLQRKHYFIPDDVSGDGQWTTFCLAFQHNDGDVSIIGSVQQQGMRVTYDLTNKLIGFSQNKC